MRNSFIRDSIKQAPSEAPVLGLGDKSSLTTIKLIRNKIFKSVPKTWLGTF